MRYEKGVHCADAGPCEINEFCIKQGDSINRSGFKLLQNGIKLISHSLRFDKSDFRPVHECVYVESERGFVFCSLRVCSLRDFHVTLDENDY